MFMISFWEEIGRDKTVKYLLIIPVIVALVGVVIYPFAYSIWLSLHDVTIMNYFHPPFSGVDNFVRIFSDPFFWNSVRVTFTYVILATVMELLLGFLLASLMNRNVKGTAIFIYPLIAPLALSPVVVGLMFRMGLNRLYGPISYYLNLLNLPRNLLSDVNTALPTLVAIDIWQWTPFVFVILYAGLQALPKEPFEAALMDGASGWQRLWYITLPLLKPVLAVAVIFRIMDSFKTFDIVFILTKGGPGKSTETISIFIQRMAMVQGNMGLGAATTLLVLILITVFTQVYVKYFSLGEKKR